MKQIMRRSVETDDKCGDENVEKTFKLIKHISEN
jgi:hypothetical protein